MEVHEFQSFAKNNIMTTGEVAEKLRITRQRLNAIVKGGELTPFKKTSQISLFFRKDVEDYLRTKGQKLPDPTIFPPKFFDRKDTTFESVEFFKENINKMKDIVAAYIYFDDVDACLDNFFLPSPTLSYGELKCLDVPSLVLRDSQGDEMWLKCCNCGYGGTGPHGSAEVLTDCGFPKKYIDYIFKYRIVKYLKDDNGNIEVYPSNGLLIDEKTKDYPNSGTARLFFYKGHLVLMQDEELGGKDPQITLQQYRAFVPNPVEIVVFPTPELAKANGYFFPGRRGEQIFTIIVRDISGKELWLRLLNEGSLKKHIKLQKLLEDCGFSIPITSPLVSWAKSLVRSAPAEPIRLTNN